MTVDFIHSCQGKRPYLTEAEALAMRKQIEKNGKGRRFTGLTAYKCKFCAWWHLGHAKRVKG